MDKGKSTELFIENAASRGRKPGLSRVRYLAEKLGDPQDSLRIIHVSGTNGKGSFGAMLTSILTEAGLRTGWFSSPALTGVTDSFHIDGKEADMGVLAEVIADIIPIDDEMSDKPTQFEMLTAAAFELFRREKCDIAVIECGLGGDLDSTNIITSPLLSVITNVCPDHTDVLGKTTAEIASHKAGIIKQERPVLFGGTDDAALAVIKKAADDCGSELFTVDYDRLKVVSETISGTVIDFGGYGRMTLSLLGAYQPYNAAVVLTAVEVLGRYGVSISPKAVADGLSHAQWHGRFEVLRRNPYIIYDGAHNPDGVALAAESIRKYFGGRKVVLFMCVMADKDRRSYADVLGDIAELAVTASPDIPRALDSRVLAEEFEKKGIPSRSFDSFGEGVRYAVSYAKKLGVPLVVLGTLYMYPYFIGELNEL